MMNIKRVVLTAILALAMVVSMVGYTWGNADSASAHTPDSCTHTSHWDWHTIYFHYDYHHIHSYNTTYGHDHWAHNHTHNYWYWAYGPCPRHY